MASNKPTLRLVHTDASASTSASTAPSLRRRPSKPSGGFPTDIPSFAAASPKPRRPFVPLLAEDYPFTRWVLALHEPLVPIRVRAEIEAEVQDYIERRPRWASFFFAGYCYDVMATLPAPDPWRNLSAKLEVGKETFVHEAVRGAPAPKLTGAVLPDGQKFIDYVAAIDLIDPEIGLDPGLDIHLVALAETINPTSAAILALATGRPDSFPGMLELLYHQLWLEHESGATATPAGQQWLHYVGTALCWAIHRRRIYAGIDDLFVVRAGLSWIAQADRLNATDSPNEAEQNFGQAVGFVDQDRIPDDAYDQLYGF